MAPANRAAWLLAKQSATMVVKDAPYRSPGPNELVIKNSAVAMNPVDHLIQDHSNIMFTWLKYPFILGFDVAGTVVEVGPPASPSKQPFKVGDRVLGLAIGSDKVRNDAAQGGFQEYVVLKTNMTAKVNSSTSFADASVVPLGAATAAAGLFQKKYLNLNLPVADTSQRKPTGKTLIVWGGSTSVGANAIQLGVAAGYEVISTASPRNHAFVRGLGAAAVFDYNSKSVVDDMVEACRGKDMAGALAIGSNAADCLLPILSRCEGNRFISLATFPLPDPLPKSALSVGWAFVSWLVSFRTRSFLGGVKSSFLIGSDIADNEVGAAIFNEFLGPALENGSYQPAPKADVVGHGLESVQDAVNILKNGVSAKKVVVTL